MRWRYVLASVLGMSAAAATAGDDFPYTAYVNSADVYVRSGPGRDYYPTDKLQKGQKVEIYRHDPGGWLAIRPPRGSFAWVSRRHLQLDSDGTATVTAARAVARVGSAFTDARDVIQVRLDKGEKVEILEAPVEESTWCKIAPPSGEFRWLFSKFVDRELPGDLADDERRASRDVRLASGQDEDSNAADEDETQRGHHASSSTSRSGTDRELDRIDLAISAMVVQDISAWKFDDLNLRAETALREAQTADDRGRARVMMSKLARFNDIKQRHEAIRASGGLDRRAAPHAAVDPAAPPDAGRYDGVGRLSPVISEKVGGPQYALVDSTNTVVSFITPAPGVNLRPYVDRYVGVNGQRGYLSELQRQHINVQRVTLLDAQRR